MSDSQLRNTKNTDLSFRVVERRGTLDWPAPGEFVRAKGTSVSCWPDRGCLLEGIKTLVMKTSEKYAGNATYWGRSQK